MSKYETTFICTPELPSDKVEELVEKTKKVIENSKGQILMTQNLGQKRLAYPIKKHREGSYVYIEVDGAGETVSALEKFYSVNDSIIRYLTVKSEKKPEPQKNTETTENKKVEENTNGKQ